MTSRAQRFLQSIRKEIPGDDSLCMCCTGINSFGS